MTTLRNAFFFFALTLGLVACGGGGGTAVGKWDINIGDTIAAAEKMMNERMADVPDDQKAMIQTMIKPMLDAMKGMKAVMDIKADGTFLVDTTGPDGQPSKVTGTWKLEGDRITMVGKEEGKPEETVVGTLKGDTISCEMGDDEQKMTMVFNRQK